MLEDAAYWITRCNKSELELLLWCKKALDDAKTKGRSTKLSRSLSGLLLVHGRRSIPVQLRSIQRQLSKLEESET